MDIKYNYKNVESLEEGVVKYIDEKISSVGKLIEVLQVKVDLSDRKENNKVFMKVSVFTTKGDEFQAKNHGVSFMECVDIIEEELKKQIRRFKERNRDLRERGGRSIKKKLTIDENARL